MTFSRKKLLSLFFILSSFSLPMAYSKAPVEKEDLSAGIKSETEYEKVIRSQAILDAREKCFTIFGKA